MNEKIINKLFKLCDKSLKKGEFPVAAIIVKDNKIVSSAYNIRNNSNLTTDHAEIIAINKANKKLKSWRLDDCYMFVTLEPCEMCKSVIKEARIKNIYYFVKKNETSKQYKRCKFFLINSNVNLINNYINTLQTFFTKKR